MSGGWRAGFILGGSELVFESSGVEKPGRGSFSESQDGVFSNARVPTSG